MSKIKNGGLDQYDAERNLEHPALKGLYNTTHILRCRISGILNKCLANTKRPCDCRVLCLRLKSLLCSCALPISDMTSFGCRDQGRDSVRQCSECQREEI